MNATKDQLSTTPTAPAACGRLKTRPLVVLGRAAVLLGVLLGAGIAWGVPVVDQSQTGPYGFAIAGSTTCQTFTVGLAGEFTGVDLRIFSPPGQGGNEVVEVRSTLLSGSYRVPTPDSTRPLASLSVPLTSIPSSLGDQTVFTHFDLSAAQLSVTPGEVLAIALHDVQPQTS